MILLCDVRDWLKTFGIGQSFYIGKMDAKKEKSIGVYQRNSSVRPRIALGGLECTGYGVKSVSILIHWNRNARETEEAAAAFFEKLQMAKEIMIGDAAVYFLQLEVSEPQDVGTDDQGIYERVIWFDLYERK